jgi:hypothetical protein
MEPIVILALFVAAVAVVLLTSIIKNTGWDHRSKNLLATILSVVVASLGVWFGVGGFDFQATDMFLAITSLYGTSQLLYNFIMHNTAFNRTLTDVQVFGGENEVSGPYPDNSRR